MRLSPSILKYYLGLLTGRSQKDRFPSALDVGVGPITAWRREGPQWTFRHKSREYPGECSKRTADRLGGFVPR
jgi:hypothetical protein